MIFNATKREYLDDFGKVFPCWILCLVSGIQSARHLDEQIHYWPNWAKLFIYFIIYQKIVKGAIRMLIFDLQLNFWNIFNR